MRPSTRPGQLAAEVQSSTFGDRLLVTATRGDHTTGLLPVTGFRFDWDTARLVQGQASLVFADNDGQLWPRDIGDPLAPGGSRLDIAYQYGATGTIIPLGRWRIRRTTPHLRWQYRQLAGQPNFLPGGGTVAVQADEDTVTLWLDRLDIGHRRPERATLLQEIARLADGWDLAIHPDVTDRAINPARVYDEDRLATIRDLLASIGATYRQTLPGTLEIIPATGTPADWRVTPGPGGTLIDLQTSMSDDGLINAVTSHATLEDERTLTGRAHLTDGPLAYGGPFGRVRRFRGANLATTQEQVDQDAATTLANATAQGDLIFDATTLTNPALQPFDRLPLQLPGGPVVPAIVKGVSFSAADGLVRKSMTLRIGVERGTL